MKKLEGLQILRALAALLVVLDHTILAFIDTGALPDWMAPVAYRAGSAGVALFFVISGFVMMHAAPPERGPVHARTFIVRRLGRIAPLYWLATLAWAAHLAADGAPPAFWDLARSFLFIPYLDAGAALRPVLGVGWTLNVEMYFYILFASGLLLPGRWGAIGLSALIAGGVAMGWIFGPSSSAGRFLTDPVLLYFPLGMAAKVLSRHLRAQSWGPALLVLATILWAIVSGDAFGSAMLVLAPTLVLLAATVPARKLGRPASLLGDASYSTYLLHGFVVGPLAALLPAALAAPVVIGLCQLVGLAGYRWLEMPINTFVRNWLGRGASGHKRVPAG